MSDLFAVTVVLADDLLALNRAVGIVRRRNLPVESLSLGPGQAAGELRLTALLAAPPDAIDRMVKQLRKMIGVRLATASSCASGGARELVRLRLRPHRGRKAAALDLLAHYEARVQAEDGDELVAEATAPPASVGALLRGLEPLGRLTAARSGPIALPSAPGLEVTVPFRPLPATAPALADLPDPAAALAHPGSLTPAAGEDPR